MATKVNDKALSYAKSLIRDGKLVDDKMDDWSEKQPSTDDENDFIDKHGMKAFGKWHLGIDKNEDPDNKGAYSFPYGDFKKVYRGGVIAAKVRAAQFDHDEVKKAADQLLKMIDKE
jgi:hypothetical protein